MQFLGLSRLGRRNRIGALGTGSAEDHRIVVSSRTPMTRTFRTLAKVNVHLVQSCIQLIGAALEPALTLLPYFPE